jgi:transcriptional regulatory protein AMDR
MEAVDRVLAKWLTELPPDLCTRPSQTSAKGGSKTNIWRSLLFMTYNTALMQFHRHRPFELRDVDNAVEASDSEICTEAASSLIQIFDDLQQLDLLGRCWFSAPSSLFTAMLQISGELKSSNPILTLRYKEKYDSGLYCLKKLSKHWLYATSIFHLFQNSFSKPRHATSAATTAGGPPAIIPEQVSPELESPTTTSSTGAPVPGSHAMEHHPQNGNIQEMNWMQLFSLGDANTSNINMEQNRWLTSINDWQSLYWSDPLANMRLDDNFGDLQFDWTR